LKFKKIIERFNELLELDFFSTNSNLPLYHILMHHYLVIRT
jgi:hypothetical protein